jgi:hypothetical protein
MQSQIKFNSYVKNGTIAIGNAVLIEEPFVCYIGN